MDNKVFYPCIYDITPIFSALALKGLSEMGTPEKIEIRGAMLAFSWTVKTPMGDGSDADDLIETTIVYDPSSPDEWSLDFYSHETLEEYGIDPIKLTEVNDVLVNCVIADAIVGAPTTIARLKAYCDGFV